MSPQSMKYFPATIVITFIFFYCASTAKYPSEKELAKSKLKDHSVNKGTVWCQLVCNNDHATSLGLYKPTPVIGMEYLSPRQTLQCNCFSKTKPEHLSSWLNDNEVVYVIPIETELYVLQLFKNKNKEILIFKGYVCLVWISVEHAIWPIRYGTEYLDYESGKLTQYSMEHIKE